MRKNKLGDDGRGWGFAFGFVLGLFGGVFFWSFFFDYNTFSRLEVFGMLIIIFLGALGFGFIGNYLGLSYDLKEYIENKGEKE